MRNAGRGTRMMAEETGGLERDTRALVQVAMAVATGDTAALRDRLLAARAAGVPPGWVDELLLQSLLNVGYARGLQAFGVWREVTPTGSPDGGAESLSHADWRGWRERGARVCREVYGRTYHKLLVNLRALHPALEALVVVDAYGKLIGRGGLDLRRRELCTLAEIAVLDTPRQLRAHLRGALNSGATVAQVEEVLALVGGDVGKPQAERARRLWDEVRRRKA
jgi:4-carboxymuconolactone decarboxylase